MQFKYCFILFCKLVIFCFATRHQMLFLYDVIAHYTDITLVKDICDVTL